MGRKNKLKKFSDLLNFSNVFENYDYHDPVLIGKAGEEVDLKGKWREAHFKNANPIILELACGRGEYSLGLARLYPERNFIGADIKGARIWKGASTALQDKLNNVAFLRCRIELIEHFFEKGEVDEIWITFPDPFLRESKSNRRLTSTYFLDKYKKILKPNGVIHLKTDETNLFEFTLETLRESQTYELIESNKDIYSDQLPIPELELKTYYERMHLEEGKKIKYIRFQLT